jgi:A/G-specific adenine glycosylase
MPSYTNGRWSLSAKMSFTNSSDLRRADLAVAERRERNKPTLGATKTRLPKHGTAGDVLRTAKPARLSAFRRLVWQHYRNNGRHDLPWRKTNDPYKILVSEIMLQQTQVLRVTEKYKSFIKKFPTVRALARAPLADVLKEWSGLGYNRRAKYLHEAAKQLAAKKKINTDDFKGLPGVGPYTASAVSVFAFNKPDVLIETNIRTAYIHHFYPLRTRRVLSGIADSQLLVLARRAAEGSPLAGGPREWYWALMDYGAYLKKSGVRNNHQSAHYTKQSKFEGSLRQIRGAILRQLHEGPKAEEALKRNTARQGLAASEGKKWKVALEGLIKDGLVKRKGRMLRIS